MPEFKPGDIVVMRSGSPPMVFVSSIMVVPGAFEAVVTYWSNQRGRLETGRVPKLALTFEGEAQK